MDKLVKKIWLIDDDPLTNMIHEILLDHYDPTISVHTFSFAGDAIEALSDKQNIPDLIFLDINMPEIDGWQFLDRFQLMEIGCRLIMLSSSIYDEDIARARSYEVVENFVSKPLIIDHLRALILKENSVKNILKV